MSGEQVLLEPDQPRDVVDVVAEQRDLDDEATTGGDVQAIDRRAVGEREGLTLPQSAVVLRDGFHWVFALGAGDKVSQLRVAVGTRVGERIEIVSGLPAGARVVAQGAGFLVDGDTVRVAAAAK